MTINLTHRSTLDTAAITATASVTPALPAPYAADMPYDPDVSALRAALERLVRIRREDREAQQDRDAAILRLVREEGMSASRIARVMTGIADDLGLGADERKNLGISEAQVQQAKRDARVRGEFP